MSDTHNRQDEITKDLKELEADMLIHTGDFSDDGTEQEYQEFNKWLGEIKDRFPLGIYVVLGNHDYKFLDALSSSDDIIATMTSDEKRRKYMQQKISNAIVLDNEVKTISVGNLSLTIFGSPWNPFQSSPTYPDRVIDIGGTPKTDHDRVFLKWSELISAERKKQWGSNEAWRYDEIPTDGSVDILLTHVPPFGVFDKQPLVSNWGSSQPLFSALKNVKPRAHIFGHVHAQRGFWEKKINTTEIVGGVQYASTTNEQSKNELITDFGVQFLANSALMSDRTVNPFSAKKIAGIPRILCGSWITKDSKRGGEWFFHSEGGGQK